MTAEITLNERPATVAPLNPGELYNYNLHQPNQKYAPCGTTLGGSSWIENVITEGIVTKIEFQSREYFRRKIKKFNRRAA